MTSSTLLSPSLADQSSNDAPTGKTPPQMIDHFQVVDRSQTIDHSETVAALKDEINAFLLSSFPQTKCVLKAITPEGAIVSHPIGEAELRPGNTVSGPTMMEVADVALYITILAHHEMQTMVATSNMTINFLRKPSANADLIAECKLIKSGKTLITGEISLFSADSDAIVAHAVGTYSRPPASKA